MDLPPYVGESMLLLGVTLVVAIVAGSLLMIVVSFLLLTVLAGLAYRVRVIKRNLARDEDEPSL
jgi:hypothetical protein